MFFDRLTDKSEFWPGLEKQDLEQGENIYRYVKSCLLKYKYISDYAWDNRKQGAGNKKWFKGKENHKKVFKKLILNDEDISWIADDAVKYYLEQVYWGERRDDVIDTIDSIYLKDRRYNVLEDLKNCNCQDFKEADLRLSSNEMLPWTKDIKEHVKNIFKGINFHEGGMLVSLASNGTIPGDSNDRHQRIQKIIDAIAKRRGCSPDEVDDNEVVVAIVRNTQRHLCPHREYAKTKYSNLIGDPWRNKINKRG